MEATKDGGDFEMKPPASPGPYVLDEWKPEPDILLTRNPNWKGPKPGFDEIHILPIDDEKTAELAYQAGDSTSPMSASLRCRTEENRRPPKHEGRGLSVALLRLARHEHGQPGAEGHQPAQGDPVRDQRAADPRGGLFRPGAMPRPASSRPGPMGHREKALVPVEGDLDKAREFLEKAGGRHPSRSTIDTTNTTALEDDRRGGSGAAVADRHRGPGSMCRTCGVVLDDRHGERGRPLEEDAAHRSTASRCCPTRIYATELVHHRPGRRVELGAVLQQASSTS